MPTLDFKGKPFIYSHHLTVPFRALVPDAARSHGPKAADGNLIVHGDSLHALKALLPRFAGKIDCIYAAPFYNTGSDGFRYTDEVRAPLMAEWLKERDAPIRADDPERHDKWLCMMWPRLRVLHELLAEDGAIFISIDDNEVNHLKVVMDEIFQSENFLLTFAWEKRYAPPPDVKDIGYTHESIVAYRKSDLFERRMLPRTPEQIARYKNPDNDPRGNWKAMDYTCRYSKEDRPNLYYPIVHPKTGQEVWPKPTRVWANSKEEHERHVREKLLWWGADGGNAVPAFKNFITKARDGMMPVSLLKYEKVGHTDEAAKELREILPDVKHDAKPTRLIEHLLTIGAGPDALVLDPFGGSGETAQAVLALNRKDSGSRRFIVVQPEPYADTVTAERVRRVMKGVAGASNEELRNGYGGGFTYCTLGNSIEVERLLKGENLPDFLSLARHVFYTATGRPLDEVANPNAIHLIGETDVDRVHLIYKPDLEFLQSPDAALNADLVKRIVAANTEGKRTLVFAPAKFMSQRDLTSSRIEFCQLPFALQRTNRV